MFPKARDQSLKPHSILSPQLNHFGLRSLAEYGMEILVAGFSKGRHFSAIEMSWQTSPNLNPVPWYFQLLLLQPCPMPGQTYSARGRPYPSLSHEPHIQGHDQDHRKALDTSLTGTLWNLRRTADSKCSPSRKILLEVLSCLYPCHFPCYPVFSAWSEMNQRTLCGKAGGLTSLCWEFSHLGEATRKWINCLLQNLNLATGQ